MARGRAGWVATLLLVAAFLGLCAVPVLVWQSFWAGFGFMSAPPDPADVVLSHRLGVAAFWTAVAAGVVGVVVGWWVRSAPSVVVMAVVLTGCFAVFTAR